MSSSSWCHRSIKRAIAWICNGKTLKIGSGYLSRVKMGIILHDGDLDFVAFTTGIAEIPLFRLE
jgi:hypothetical protein